MNECLETQMVQAISGTPLPVCHCHAPDDTAAAVPTPGGHGGH